MNHPKASSGSQIGFASATALVVASMIGAVIFTGAGFALGALGSPERVLLVWAIGGAIATAGAISYGALSQAIRESGGEYVYLARRVHPLAGFLAGWVSLIAGFTGALAIAATTFEEYAEPLFSIDLPRGTFAIALIFVCALQHSLGVTGGARLQNLVVAGKIVGLVAMIFCGGWWIAGRTQALPAVTPPEFDWSTFGQQLTWVYLGYSGFNAAVYVSEEVHRPERTLPRAMLVGTLLVTVLYLALNALFVYSAPIAELANQEDIAAVALGHLGGPTASWWCRVLICVALVTSASALTMSGPRVYAKMASDRLFPLPAPTKGVPPRSAIALQAVLACGFVLVATLQDQLNYLSFILMVTAAAAVASLVWVNRSSNETRPTWWQLSAAMLFVAAAIVLAILSALRDPFSSAIAGFTTLAVGVVFYFGMRRLDWRRSGRG